MKSEEMKLILISLVKKNKNKIKRISCSYVYMTKVKIDEKAADFHIINKEKTCIFLFLNKKI